MAHSANRNIIYFFPILGRSRPTQRSSFIILRIFIDRSARPRFFFYTHNTTNLLIFLLPFYCVETATSMRNYPPVHSTCTYYFAMTFSTTNIDFSTLLKIMAEWVVRITSPRNHSFPRGKLVSRIFQTVRQVEPVDLNSPTVRVPEVLISVGDFLTGSKHRDYGESILKPIGIISRTVPSVRKNLYSKKFAWE